MNWLGASFGAVLAAVIGTIVGAFLRYWAARFGFDFPPIVGIVAGVSAALASSERSGHRGILVASFAVWAAALEDILVHPSHGVVHDVLHFSERLTPASFVSYVVCAIVALFLGARAARGLRSEPSDATASRAPDVREIADATSADSRPAR